MNKHLIIIGIAVLLICVGFSGCFDTDTEYTSDLPTADDIQILNHNISHDYYSSVVNGTGKNIGDKQVSVIIKAKFYDENDVLLNTGSDYISDVDPDEIFAFKITYFNFEEVVVDHYTIGIDSVI